MAGKKMATNIYTYTIKTTQKKGILIEKDGCFGDISPLNSWSEETFEEAFSQTLSVLENKTTPSLPSVKFGLNCLKKNLKSFSVKLCALNVPKGGCRSLKLKLGDLSLEEAIAKTTQYKSLFSLRLDFNQKWSLEKILKFSKYFKSSDFEYLEDPTATYKELVEFSNKTRFPIAVDAFFRQNNYHNIPSLKAVVIKPTLTGFIPHLSLPVILSSSYESSVGLAHIASCASNDLCQGLDTFENDFFTPPLYEKNGYLIWDGSINPVKKEKLCFIKTVPS